MNGIQSRFVTEERPMVVLALVGAVALTASLAPLAARIFADGSSVSAADLGADVGVVVMIASLLVVALVRERTHRHATAALRRSEEHSRTLLESIQHHVIFKDRRSRFVAVNEVVAREFGRPRESFRGLTDFDLFPPVLAKAYRADDERVMASRRPQRHREVNVVEGESRIVEVTKAPVISDKGAVLGVLCLFEDVSEHARAEQALAESEERQRTVIELLRDGIVVVDETGTVIECNGSAELILGNDAGTLVGRPFGSGDWAALREDGSPVATDDGPVARTLTSGVSLTDIVQGITRPDGTLVWVSIDTSPLQRPSEQTPHGVVASFSDVSARRRRMEALEHAALHDALTGLPNRLLFHDRVRQALAARAEEGEVAVLMIDLDGFKGVNDRHGHAAGDDVLREVAARIARSIRTGDTAARLGGDEFAVLLTGVSGPELVDATSERIRTAVDAPWIVAGAAVDLCASVGQAVTTPQSTTPAELLRRADAAMYHDKRTRRAAAAAPEDREARPNGRGRPGRSAVHATAGG